uniref:SCD domain-containing protein n=1 Tax=Globodera rostochiensis TaxID=31243 RepID=A0A914I8W6_GLORO
MHSTKTSNTYSLRVRKAIAFDRDYSPDPPGQPRGPRKYGGVNQQQQSQTGRNPTNLAEKWIHDYEESPDQAIVQMLQLIIASCGCSGKLDANMIHNMQWKDIIERISEYFDEDSGDYPLILTTHQFRRFRNNFAEFLQSFVIRSKNNILFDVTLMDSLIQLLTLLSDNPIRAFRHTATFASMKLSSSIVDVVVELVDLKDKNVIQIETEKARLLHAGTNERLERLLQAKTELDQKIDELSAMLQYIFKCVFVHRYRDHVADFRIICVSELGIWIRIYPALFLDDSYLKYIGWSLFDKVPEVRQKCISALLPLYENNKLIRRLELFTHKFKDRLVSMVMDTDVEVATKTCQLMTHIYRAFPVLLDPGACVPLYELVYCNNRQLAVAAGEFVNAKLFSTATDGSMMSSSTSILAPPVDNRQLIKDLVAFFIDGDVHRHPAYLVDSLIDICPMLKDWPTMVDILLSEEFDQFDTHLIAIVCAAVKQAATGEHPPNRIVVSIRRGPGAGTEKKDLRMLQDERVHLSEVFILALPRLLQKFIADQEKVRDLIEIFLYFELEIYSAGRYEQPLNELMVLLERIVEQYSNDEITTNIARVFQFITSNMSVAQFTDTSRCRIVDGVVQNLRQQMQMFMANEEEQLDEEDEASLLSSFRKMVAFTSTIDVAVKWDFWDMCMDLLQNSNRFQSADLVEKTVLLCFQLLSWDMKRFVAAQEQKEETIELLRKRRDQFLKVTKSILRDQAAGVENAFMCICDILIMFNWKLAADYGPDHHIHVLAIKVDKDMICRITEFVMDNVFVLEENDNVHDMAEPERIQLMAKRRNLLAQYSKLFIYGLLPVIDSVGVLRQFTRFFSDFGDIMKQLLQKCREMDKWATAKAIVFALINSYEELKLFSEESVVDQDSENFQALRELAKRFALSFGVDNLKNREALAVIHHDGIKFALSLDPKARQTQRTHENVSFFEILQEFSPKLHRQDKLAVLRYLDKNCSPDTSHEDGDAWQTYLLYRSSLAKAE